MPISLPNLDDRSYAELTAQARTLIPGLLPAWTNHNPSDPGIVLVELLAWLTEMLLFQVDQVPAANTEKFLALLNGPTWTRAEGTSLDAAVRQTIVDVRERYRAVTPADFERLAGHAWPGTDAARQFGDAGRLHRVRCVPHRNLAATDPATRGAPAPAHMSLVVLPATVAGTPGTAPQPTGELLAALWTFLDDRVTLTTRHHVIGPDYVPVTVSANLAPHPDAPPERTPELARQALAAFFDPRSGGPDRSGWPFGRAVYVSEVYAVLEQLSTVDYVEDVRVATAPGGDRIRTGEDGSVVGIELDAHELVRLEEAVLVAYDAYGRQLR